MNATLEAYRNCYKSDTGTNPSGDTTEEQAQAYLDWRATKMAENIDAGRDQFAGIAH